MYIVRKDYDGAEAMYRKVIELDPKNALAHKNLRRLLAIIDLKAKLDQHLH